MTKETKNKSKGWFKNVLSTQNQFEHTSDDEEVSTEVAVNPLVNEEETRLIDSPSNKELFSKESQDKVALDMIVSLENMLNDRHLILYKKEGLENQLHTANETISRLKHDLVKKEQFVHDKNKEIRVLESNLTNKQMSYDQLLEDYKEYQSTSNKDFENVSNQLEKGLSKYNMLKEESTNAQYQSMLTIKELEEKVRNLDVENQKYAEQYANILNEKEELMQTINDFTERMSFSFSPKATPSEK